MADSRENLEVLIPCDRLIKTEKYKQFASQQYDYLFCLDGTGKKSIIRLLEYEINEGQNIDFQYISIVCKKDDYFRLLSCLNHHFYQNYSFRELSYLLRKKWNWIIYVSAMVQLLKKNPQSFQEQEDIAVIKKYVTNTVPKEKLVDFVCECIETAIRDDQDGHEKSPLILQHIHQQLYSDEYEVACRALRSFLKRNNYKCLAIFSCMNVEDAAQNFSKLSFKAMTYSLVQTIEALKDEKNGHIHAKVIFPSEIYCHIIAYCRGKIEKSMLFLQWTYKELVLLLANKLAYEKGYKEYFTDLSASKAYIYSYIPGKLIVRKKYNFELDTLFTLFRNTRKNPNLVIPIFKQVQKKVEEKAEKHDIKTIETTENRSCYYDVIFNAVKPFAEENINLYNKIYPGSKEFIKQMFKNKGQRIFDEKYLQERLQEASTNCAVTFTLLEIRMILIEMELLGVYSKEKVCNYGNLKIVPSRYDYQVRGRLVPDYTKVSYSIHPIYYEELDLPTCDEVFVFPNPDEAEELGLFKEIGIDLG